MSCDIAITLCVVCENFRDVDKIVSREGFKHHSSYTALCKAADDGCDLCQSFLSAGLKRSHPNLPPLNFDESMDASLTQITWNHHSGCLFMLRQEALVRVTDCFNLWVEIYTPDDDPLAKFISGRPTQETSNSKACFDLISGWMDKCKTGHRFCTQDADRALPNRVIDVGSDSREPFLYDTKSEKGQWVTLSHCWGDHIPFKTTMDTIRQRGMSIPLKELQFNFRDAILITRKLGFQYLWIDALCIIQDSPEDWAHESTQMHKIYSGASLNISATAARSGQDGIFSSADKDRFYMKPFVHLSSYSNSAKVGGLLSIRKHSGRFPMTPITDQPLHKRGWVLQESTLSPRRLDFSSEQLYWSCRTSSFTEGDPFDIGIQISQSSRKELFKMPLGLIPPRPGQSRVRDRTPMSWWHSTLSIYCNLNFTFAGDYLPAIGGIATKVKERTSYNYKAGLWLEDFHRGLLWRPETTVQRLEDTPVPSWSWASVKFPWIASWRVLALDIYMPGFRASVLEVNVHTLEDNPFGPVISASLIIEGGCSTFERWQTGTDITYNTPRNRIRLVNRWLDPKQHHAERLPWLKPPPPGCILCTLDERLLDKDQEPDYETNIHSELIRRKAIILLVAKFGHVRYPDMIETNREIATVYALILEPTGRGGLGEYKRIGIAEIPEENGLLEGWSRRIVTIV